MLHRWISRRSPEFWAATRGAYSGVVGESLGSLGPVVWSPAFGALNIRYRMAAPVVRRRRLLNLELLRERGRRAGINRSDSAPPLHLDNIISYSKVLASKDIFSQRKTDELLFELASL